jgi:type IV secretory pathway protease TraF
MNRTRPFSARFVLSMAAAVALMAALPFAVRHSGFVINYSDSVRPRLFFRTTDAHAPYIAFCAPESADPAVLRAAFAQLPHGDCPGGRSPLLKPFIEATMDHPVTLGPNGFTFDGKLLPNTAPKPLSRLGSRLTHYPFGRYHFGIWPISIDSPDSYDARYFGPIPPSAIRYRAIAVIGGSHGHA